MCVSLNPCLTTTSTYANGNSSPGRSTSNDNTLSTPLTPDNQSRNCCCKLTSFKSSVGGIAVGVADGIAVGTINAVAVETTVSCVVSATGVGNTAFCFDKLRIITLPIPK